MGDGANDRAHDAGGGLSVGFHPKPAVRREADVTIEAGGLDRLLQLFTPGTGQAPGRRGSGQSVDARAD